MTKDNKLIKYHNDMNIVSFSSFHNREMNLFFSICSLMAEEGTKKVEISFDYIKKLSSLVFRTEEEFVKYLISTNDKLLNLTGRFQKGSKIAQFVLFPTFIIDTERKTLAVGINREFGYILNELTKHFTIFELQEFNSLRSTYSKHLFRLLKQFKTTGFMRISVEDFKKQLGYPKWYRMSDIDKEIFKYCLEELPAYFQELRITKVKEGRRIAEFHFSFIPQPPEIKDSALPQHPIYCPFCNEKLEEIYSKENGSSFWGHRNFKLNDCKETFSSVEEIEKARKKVIKKGESLAQKEEIQTMKEQSLEEIKQIISNYPQYFEIARVTGEEIFITNFVEEKITSYPLHKKSVELLKVLIFDISDKKQIKVPLVDQPGTIIEEIDMFKSK